MGDKKSPGLPGYPLFLNPNRKVSAMQAKIDTKKNTLTLTMALLPAGSQSNSGKTFLLASESGKIEIPGLTGVIKCGVNVYSKTDSLASVEVK